MTRTEMSIHDVIIALGDAGRPGESYDNVRLRTDKQASHSSPAEEGKPTDIEQFCDDDHGYPAWTATHAAGYVINVQRNLNPSDARLHHADCSLEAGQVGSACQSQPVRKGTAGPEATEATEASSVKVIKP